MNNKSLIIKSILLLGIISGLIFFIMNSIFLLLGAIIIILSVGVFKSWKMIRIPVIFFSFLVVPMYFYLLFIYIRHFNMRDHFYWGIGLISYSPTFIWCIISTHFCIKHREYFKKSKTN